MSKEKELEIILKEMSEKGATAHKEFNSGIVSLCAGLLTISITGISIFTKVNLGLNWLIISWIFFATILIIITLYNMLNAEAYKYGYEVKKETVRISKVLESGTQLDRKEINRLKRKYKMIELKNNFSIFIYHNSHWIVFIMFLCGMISLMVFTIKNVNENKGNPTEESQKIDLEIKKLELQKLKQN